jgi:hypothetical protein
MGDLFTQIVLMAMFGIGICIILPEFVFKAIEYLLNFFRKHRNI